MTELRRDEFTLAVAGDSILTRRVLPHEGTDERFDDLLELLRDADASLTNLEVVLPEEGTPATPPRTVPDQFQYLGPLAGILMRARPFVLDELAGMGFSLFSAASNHSFDYGRPGMVATAAALRERELTYAGLGGTLAEARAPAYRETPGGRVAVVSANSSVAPGSEAGAASSRHPGRPGINPLHLRWVYGALPEQIDALRELSGDLGVEAMKGTWLSRDDPNWSDEERFHFMHMSFEAVDDEADVGPRYEPHPPDRDAFLDSVRVAARNADRVVATLHCHQGPGGTRNVPGTPAFLPEFARACVDAGADAFVGHGPHVLRGIEVYDGAPLFYSLGNFCYQTETVGPLPPESYEYYGVDPDAPVSDLLDARYDDGGGEASGGLRRRARWETVVPVCTFEGDSLSRLELHPCSLGRTRPRPRRGTPALASGDRAAEILDRVAELSAPFGTTVGREGDVGVVEL